MIRTLDLCNCTSILANASSYLPEMQYVLLFGEFYRGRSGRGGDRPPNTSMPSAGTPVGSFTA
jgi:hypothetical protein